MSYIKGRMPSYAFFLQIQELEATVCEFNGDQSLLQTRL